MTGAGESLRVLHRTVYQMKASGSLWGRWVYSRPGLRYWCSEDGWGGGGNKSYIIQNKLSKDSPKASRTSPLHLTPASSFLDKTVAQPVKNPLVPETWVGKIPWRREWLPTPVFWPGESHGLYRTWGRKEFPKSPQRHDWVTFTCTLVSY